jgi:hypothetical protein
LVSVLGALRFPQSESHQSHVGDSSSLVLEHVEQTVLFSLHKGRPPIRGGQRFSSVHHFQVVQLQHFGNFLGWLALKLLLNSEKIC